MPENNPEIQSNTKKKKPYTSIKLILLAVAVCFIIGYFVNLYSKYDKNAPNTVTDNPISSKYIDITNEEGKKIDEILKECGINDVDTFEHDELLDNAHSKGETGYRISIDVADNIILYLNKDKSVHSIVYNDNKLYKKNKAVAKIQDYTFTIEEASKWQSLCQEKVKEILKSPSTAKFPNFTEWGFGKEKNKITIQGYVDSQNSFGTEIRSKFQFIINSKSNTIKSFIFDGEELIK